jgi:NADH:ubiquinone oxidoreductase subunit
MKQLLLQVFTWWNGQTMGTRFYTWRKGERVGTDEYGNIYYRAKDASHNEGERRWVIYNGEAEASMVPQGWYGWLHHTSDEVPSENSYKPREWEQPHEPNLTGTPKAYRPDGSILGKGKRAAATGDYQAWRP